MERLVDTDGMVLVTELGDAKAGRLDAICKRRGISSRVEPMLQRRRSPNGYTMVEYPGQRSFRCPAWFYMIVERVEAAYLYPSFGFHEWHIKEIEKVLDRMDLEAVQAAFTLGGVEYVTQFVDAVCPLVTRQTVT